MKYYQINEEAARRAKQSWSFFDYVDGSKTAEYKSAVDACYSKVDKLPDELKEKGLVIADRYAKKLADWYNRQFQIEMMCPSVMVSGAGNFPVHKKKKQNAAQDKHWKLYNEIKEIPEQIDRLFHGSHIINSSDADAIQKLTDKVIRLEAAHEKMKNANAHFRKNGTMKGFGNYTDEEAEKIDVSINNSIYGVPFPSYELTSNLAKIKTAKTRIAEIERTKAEARSGNNDLENEFFKVVENSEIMRLQLFFDGKPDAETRNVLKANGFKWAPSQGAWQRQLTNNGRKALEMVIKDLKGGK